eukprot:8476487-Pyramimonas_sp.AAC.1
MYISSSRCPPSSFSIVPLSGPHLPYLPHAVGAALEAQEGREQGRDNGGVRRMDGSTRERERELQDERQVSLVA